MIDPIDFNGVSLCPAISDSRHQIFPTVIRCDCRTDIDLDRGGVYTIVSKRSGHKGDVVVHTQNSTRTGFLWIRVFPAHARFRRLHTKHGMVEVITMNEKNYVHHLFDCDLIITSIEPMNSFQYIWKSCYI